MTILRTLRIKQETRTRVMQDNANFCLVVIPSPSFMNPPAPVPPIVLDKVYQ